MFKLLSTARVSRVHLFPKIRSFSHNATLYNTKIEKPEVAAEEPSQPTVLDIADESENQSTLRDHEGVYLDTMKVYNQLTDLGFTGPQSDLILKLIRENLTINLTKLQSKILTNMELENETYLFEAAQSELKYETQHSRESDLRNLELEKYALERHLQVESDELNEYLIMSKNDSQVTINDQISENTLLQKKIKMKLQELDNKITTNINSDIKSEIEGLRWHTTISGLIAVLVLVISMMGGVSISKKINKEEQPTQVILRTLEPEEDEDIDEEAELAKKEKEELFDLELKKKQE